MLIPHYYQRDSIDELYNYYRDGNTGGALIDIATGGGKSIVIAMLIKEILTAKPNRRILMLSHVKELLSQNMGELISLWPQAPVGIYSASLKKKQIGHPITIAGIQSCYKKGTVIGFIHIIIIDEAHLLSEKDDGMYRILIAKLKQINPKLKIIGLTATPWRMKGGLLTEGENPLFDKIVYSIGIGELVDKGYLCPVISKQSKNQADLSQVPIRDGEFSFQEMEEIMDNDELINKALDEVEAYGKDRKAWLFFCSGVKHAQHVCEVLRERGISAECVTGDTTPSERDRILRDFKNGKIKALTNNTVLTTGTNIPRIDLVVLLRGTKSPGLMLQIVGRGMRRSPETAKQNCLIMDFAGNLDRFGPIDQIKAPNKKKKRDNQEAPHKFCPTCDSQWPISTLECLDCGFVFPVNIIYKHDTIATNAPAMSSEAEWLDIDETYYRRHIGRVKDGVKKEDSLCATYCSGSRIVKEWVFLNHTGSLRSEAKRWVERRLLIDPDADPLEVISIVNDFTIDDAVQAKYTLLEPIRIKVRPDGKFEKIVEFEF